MSFTFVERLFLPCNYHIGVFFYRLKKWNKSIKFFERALKKKQNNGYILYKIGICKLKQKKYVEAYNYLCAAINNKKTQTDWQKKIQICKEKLGDSFYAKTSELNIYEKRIKTSDIFFEKNKKKNLLLIPSAYNINCLEDITPYIAEYCDKFNIYIPIKGIKNDIEQKGWGAFVRNDTSYADYLKLTSEYIIDAGALNLSFKISDSTHWVSVWHGIPIKKMFVDYDEKYTRVALKYCMPYESMISISEFYTNFLKKSMMYHGEIKLLGNAKIDTISKNKNKNHIIDKYNIPKNKYIIAININNISNDLYVVIAFLEKKYANIMIITKYIESFSGECPTFVKSINHISTKEMIYIADLVISELDIDSIKYALAIKKEIILFDEKHDKSFEESKIYSYLEKNNFFDLKFFSSAGCLEEHLNSKYAMQFNNSIFIENKNFKHRLGIPDAIKILLYAPTFREKGEVSLPFDPLRLLSVLGNHYIIIVKLHYLNYLSKDENYENYVIDCSNNYSILELAEHADICVTDYSSLIFDFCLLNKPVVLFQYDFDKYNNERGFYFSFDSLLRKGQIARTEEELYSIDWHHIQPISKKIIEKNYYNNEVFNAQRIAKNLNFNTKERQSKEIIFLLNELNQSGGIHGFVLNMAKYYKIHYNTKIYVLAVKEFPISNTSYHKLESEYIDFTISAQIYGGACITILQNTDGVVISLQFSAHKFFQKYLCKAKSVLMFHGDTKDMAENGIYKYHLNQLKNGELYNYKYLILLTKSNELLIRHKIKNQIKTIYIHNSIENKFKNFSNNKKSIAIISRLDIDKNIFDIIKLAKYIKENNINVSINIYGDGPLSAALKNEINKNKLQKIINMKGFVISKDKIFSENRCLLIVSKSEGFPLVLLESYSYGIPVISYNSYTASKDLILDNITGFLIEYQNYAQIISAYYKCLDINSSDIENFYHNFTNDNVFPRWNSLFDKLYVEE